MLRALSIRQPWAWMIIHGGKRIENRTWDTSYRGEFLIHAAKGMTLDEYDDAVLYALDVDPAIDVPSPCDLERGGIVGVAELWRVIPPYDSEITLTPKEPWHMGAQHGFRLRNVCPLPFLPCKGALGFWGNFEIRDGKAVQL